MSALGDAAVRNAVGVPVFPVEVNGKSPLTTHGFKDATTDPMRIRRWWNRWPEANIAVPTGQVSGFIALDVDGELGWESLHDLEREHGLLPRTSSVCTPRGGQHFYFLWPGYPVKNTTGIAPGLDVRGDGGYVLVPPSRTLDGAYRWDEVCPPARMPEWVAGGREERSERATDPEVWVAMIRDGIPEGERNAALTRLTGHLLRRWLDAYLVEALVHLVNRHCCRPPLPIGDVDRILDSVARCELRRRAGNGR
jgi:hypothetical protein